MREYKIEDSVVAFIDILGSSEEMKRDSQKALNTVHNAYDDALAIYDTIFKVHKDIVQIRIFSDNIVLSCPCERIGIEKAFYLVVVFSALIQEKLLHYSVLSRGGIARGDFFNDEVMSALEASTVPRKKLEIIKKAKPETANPKELQTINACLTKYTDAYNNKNCKKAPMGKIIMGLMTSPDYSFIDFKAVGDNGYKGNVSLWHDILKIDLTETLNAVKMPYYIIQGETDIVASTSVAKNIVDNSGNKNLSCIVVKNTGHFPGVEMMDNVFECLCELS